MLAVGLRSGGRGGPLVIEAADVRHVLLAPIDRTVALRGPAVRQLRFGGLLGGAAGAVAGLLAVRRLPGSPIAWVASGAVVGAAIALASLGLAMVVAGFRLGRWLSTLLAVAVLAWSAADVAAGTVTSPASLLGRLALWPLAVHPLDLVALALAAVAVVAGLARVGGTALEASERRASLVGQIRFAATLQDIRTVVVLRRQLAQELPRQRPWVRLPRAVPRAWLVTSPAGARDPRRRPTATAPPRPVPPAVAGVAPGLARHPPLAGAALCPGGRPRGGGRSGPGRGVARHHPLVVVAGLALYVAGLDAVEPLAQEVDHPDRRGQLDLPSGQVHLRQLGAPAVIMVLVAAVGLLTALAVTGGSVTACQVGGLLLVPAAIAGLGGAAVSVIKGPPPPLTPDQALIPEAAGMRAMGRLLWPPIIAIAGVVPILAAHSAERRGQSVLGALSAIMQPVIILLVGVVAWVRFQEEAHIWIETQMDAGQAAAPGRTLRPGPTGAVAWRNRCPMPSRPSTRSKPKG